MAEFTVNPQRFDPYKNFRFRVKLDGRYVAGVSKVSALKRSAELVGHRDGADASTSRKSPGRTEHDAITLEYGVTHDPEFEQWASMGSNLGGGPGHQTSLNDIRKDIELEVVNEVGKVVATYKFVRCWVSEFQAVPELDGNANAIAIPHMKIEHEGWERDDDAAEQVEAGADQPEAKGKPRPSCS